MIYRPALNQQKTEFRETETALVSRIADVDDDRRLTTNRLQRAWQTHRDEIDARLKQQAKLFTGGLVLLALLLGIALLFAYSQLDNARRALLEETAQLRLDYQRLAALSTPDESVQESMASLRASLTEISASLEERQTSSTPAPAGDTGPVDPEPANAAPAFDAESARPSAKSPEPVRDETPEPASQPAIDSSLRAAPETSPEQALLPAAEAATPMTSDKGPDTLSKAEAQPDRVRDAIQDEMASEKEVRQPAAQTQTPEPVPEEPLAASLEQAVEATPLRTAEAASPTPAEAPNAPSEADAQPETAPDAIQGETASDDDLLQPAEQAPEPVPDERIAARPAADRLSTRSTPARFRPSRSAAVPCLFPRRELPRPALVRPDPQPPCELFRRVRRHRQRCRRSWRSSTPGSETFRPRPGSESWTSSGSRPGRTAPNGVRRMYILLLSIHGLIRGHDLELGRDADTGGQTKYVVDLARALAEREDVSRVDLVTRRVVDPAVSPDYAEPIETLSEKARIVGSMPDRRATSRRSSSGIISTASWTTSPPSCTTKGGGRGSSTATTRTPGYVGVRLSNLAGVPLVHTGHSLGRDKRQRLLAAGLDGEQIDARYNMVRRIDAEESVLGTADLVITSTHNEIEEQYALYDYYQPERMVVIPPGHRPGPVSSTCRGRPADPVSPRRWSASWTSRTSR
jgi:hypothetical protein